MQPQSCKAHPAPSQALKRLPTHVACGPFSAVPKVDMITQLRLLARSPRAVLKDEHFYLHVYSCDHPAAPRRPFQRDARVASIWLPNIAKQVKTGAVRFRGGSESPAAASRGLREHSAWGKGMVRGGGGGGEIKGEEKHRAAIKQQQPAASSQQPAASSQQCAPATTVAMASSLSSAAAADSRRR